MVKGCEPGSEAWRQYVTASRVPSILGLLKDFGKDDQYERDFILGLAAEETRSEEDEENMYWGTLLEDRIVQGWQYLHNRRNPLLPVRVRHRPGDLGMLASTERPWLACTPDAWGYRRDIGLFGIQIKRSMEFFLRFDGKGPDKKLVSGTLNVIAREGLKENKRTQCEAEMYVTGLPKWLLLQHVGGRRVVEHWVDRDARRERRMLEVLDLFWASVERARQHGTAA